MKKISLVVLVFLLAMPVFGCRSITFETADGKKIHYNNFLFNTKSGRIEVVTPEGAKIIIENLDSNSQALEVASKALDLANRVPVP